MRFERLERSKPHRCSRLRTEPRMGDVPTPNDRPRPRGLNVPFWAKSGLRFAASILMHKAMTPEEVFVRGVWRKIPSEDDPSWVARIAGLPATNQPLGDFGVLVRRMLECGVSEHEIARFAKIVGYETAFGISYLLDDPSAGFADTSNPEGVSWKLYQVDEATEQPIRPLIGLYEMMLSRDPSRREMRPKCQDV